MAWVKLGSTTLVSAADTITVSDLTAKKFNQMLFHDIASGNTSHSTRFNNNSNTVYAMRLSLNGGSDATRINKTIIDEPLAYVGDKFSVDYICSVSGQEKLGISFHNETGGTGAGAAPNRSEVVYKFVPSPDAGITRIDLINDQTGDHDIGSNIIVMGTD